VDAVASARKCLPFLSQVAWNVSTNFSENLQPAALFFSSPPFIFQIFCGSGNPKCFEGIEPNLVAVCVDVRQDHMSSNHCQRNLGAYFILNCNTLKSFYSS
jgi:hypothetical protein